MFSKSSYRRIDDLEQFVDLSSVPRLRFFQNHPFIVRLRRAVDFSHVLVSGLDIERFRFGSGQSVDSDFPPAFLDAYYEEKLHLSDPFVAACKQTTDVVTDAHVLTELSTNERLCYLLESFKIYNRTFIPISRGGKVYGGVGVTRDTPFDEDEISFLKAIAPALHATVTGHLMRRFAATELRLSSGELRCLRLASGGLTSEQIAVESGYQVDTVNTYIKNATKKVGANNRTQAIAEAIRRGLID